MILYCKIDVQRGNDCAEPSDTERLDADAEEASVEPPEQLMDAKSLAQQPA